MIKKNWKILLITSIVILLPIAAGLVLWNQLPEQLPFHWNAAGEIDGWASKSVAVFLMPLILLALQWVCVLATCADPKKQAHGTKVLHLVFWMIPVISIFVHMMMYMVALGKTVRVEMVMPVFMGLIFIIIGNYLPKCKQNYTIGIKIPWTLNSEENWNKTHRFAGRIWVVGGLLMMLTGFFGGFWVFFAVVLAMVLAPFIYSYILHRKGV
jgi:uncharacterized membrane protein